MEGILPSLGHYAASKKASRAEENLSTWIRLFFAISVVSLVRYARARCWVMSNVRRTFRVRIPTDFQARSQTMTRHRTWRIARRFCYSCGSARLRLCDGAMEIRRDVE
jgi:hypothetical protein